MARMGKIGLFFGLIFGTIFGVLFAPRKGKDLRQRMKTDRKKGRFGVAPLQDDLKSLGQELAEIARDLYDSEMVHEIIVKGRKKVKELSDDFVGEAVDFHTTRIPPLARDAMGEGEKTFKKAKGEFKLFKSKVKKSASIGKRALKDMKSVMKKKNP